MRLIRLKLCLIALLFTIRGAAAWADDVLFSEPFLDSEHPATMFELAIPSEGSRMPGHIYVANGPGPHPTVVLLHGLPGNEKNLDLAQALRRVGFNVLFFNFRGAWGAEGTYKLSQLDDDVLAAISFVRDETNAQQYRIDPSRLTLIGHSIGGFAALAAGSKTDDVICVGALAPTNLGLDKRDLERGGAVIEDFAAYADQQFVLAGFNGDSLIEDLKATPLGEWDTPAFAERLKGKAVLMLVGDKNAGLPNSNDLLPDLLPSVIAYRNAGVDVELRVISGDHEFSWNRLELIRNVGRWAMEDCR